MKNTLTPSVRSTSVEHAKGNVAQAARALGISRATVCRKLGEPR